MKCWEKGFYVRYGGDTIQLGLPFIVENQQIDDLINAVGESIRELDKQIKYSICFIVRIYMLFYDYKNFQLKTIVNYPYKT